MIADECENKAQTCEGCFMSKMSRAPFKRNQKRAEKPGELLHFDLVGKTLRLWQPDTNRVAVIRDTHVIESVEDRQFAHTVRPAETVSKRTRSVAPTFEDDESSEEEREATNSALLEGPAAHISESEVDSDSGSTTEMDSDSGQQVEFEAAPAAPAAHPVSAVPAATPVAARATAAAQKANSPVARRTRSSNTIEPVASRTRSGLKSNRHLAKMNLAEAFICEAEPRSHTEALASDEADAWKAAMNEEMDSLAENRPTSWSTRPTASASRSPACGSSKGR